ncbi:MAG TPA: MFS transporter [Kiloniellaceae bacterium]|nr:MFS transporter [Kiloniellaceae bacterium]
MSVALLLMGNGLQGTLLPVRAQLEDFTSIDIGALGSSYFLGFALGCWLGPRAVKRVGHIRVFTAMVAIASTTSILHLMILTPVAWWVLRAITGFCFATLYMVIESWLNEKSSNENRGFVFSVYTIVNLSVITVGQMMLSLDSPLSFTLFGLASILVSLAAVPVAMTTASAQQPIAEVRIRPLRLFRVSPIGFMGCFAVGLANGSFWSLAPVFAQSEDGNVTMIAIFMSVAVIAGAVGQYPLGRLSDRMDRRKVIIVSCVGAALAAVSLLFVDRYWEGGLLFAVGAFGFFAFPLYAVSVAHLNDFVEPDGFVEAASGLLLVFAAGAVVGPLIASSVMRAYGVDSLFAFTAAVHFATAGYAVYRLTQRVAPPEAERVQFADSFLFAQTISTVDPLPESGLEGTTGASHLANKLEDDGR